MVENELSTHDLFKHIGVQLLQFSVSFTQAGRKIKPNSVRGNLPRSTGQRTLREVHAEGGFRNLDHFLDALVLDKEFRALVIIDEETDDLHAVTRNLGFPVEIIEFSTYANDKGERIHRFEPFLADVEAELVEETPVGERKPPRDPSGLDTSLFRHTKRDSKRRSSERTAGMQSESIPR